MSILHTQCTFQEKKSTSITPKWQTKQYYRVIRARTCLEKQSWIFLKVGTSNKQWRKTNRCSRRSKELKSASVDRRKLIRLKKRLECLLIKCSDLLQSNSIRAKTCRSTSTWKLSSVYSKKWLNLTTKSCVVHKVKQMVKMKSLSRRKILHSMPLKWSALIIVLKTWKSVLTSISSNFVISASSTGLSKYTESIPIIDSGISLATISSRRFSRKWPEIHLLAFLKSAKNLRYSTQKISNWIKKYFLKSLTFLSGSSACSENEKTKDFTKVEVELNAPNSKFNHKSCGKFFLILSLNTE